MSSNEQPKLGTLSTLSIGIGGMVGGGIFAVPHPATRYHLWILVGMIVVSLAIEIIYRGITGRKTDLLQEPMDTST